MFCFVCKEDRRTEEQEDRRTEGQEDTRFGGGRPNRQETTGRQAGRVGQNQTGNYRQAGRQARTGLEGRSFLNPGPGAPNLRTDKKEGSDRTTQSHTPCDPTGVAGYSLKNDTHES